MLIAKNVSACKTIRSRILQIRENTNGLHLKI